MGKSSTAASRGTGSRRSGSRGAGSAESSARSGDHVSGEARTRVKTFVLDTNILLHDPTALFVFEDNNIVIPFTVLEELDTFKGTNNDIGRNARQAIRFLDVLRQEGQLTDGVPLEAAADEHRSPAGVPPTGTVRIMIAPKDRHLALAEDKPDNRIIAVAHSLHSAGESVIFVSKDINARVKSDALGVRAEDFESNKVNVEHLYSGYLTLKVDGDLIDELYAERMLEVGRLSDALPKREGETNGNGPGVLLPNQYVLLIDSSDPGHTGLGRRLADTEHVIPVSAPRKPVFGILPRNVQQTMALDLLLNDEIKLVTLIGSAGTGKTLLAVAAGMARVFTDGHFEKLLVARPIMPMGRDIGFLPGDKDEKLASWMQPIFDNLSYLMSTRGAPNQNAESRPAEHRIEKLMADGRLVLEPLTYIRGRSIPHQFIIVDEAQNLSPHEVKTIISRVGEDTKIVLTGDIEQIDHPYLDASSNGLSYTVDRMKGQGLVGHVTLAKSERSSLASLATERL